MNAVELIKNNIDKDVIKAILEKLGVKTIYDNGIETIRCNCPIHGGDNPTAFSWNYNNGLWFCFTGCHDGGDIFDFVSKIYNINPDKEFKRVVLQAAELCEINIDGVELGEARSRNMKELREWINFMESKTKKYVFKPFNINTVGELKRLTSYRNFNTDICTHFEAQYSPILNRIVIPIYRKGDLIAISTRAVNQNQEPKWVHYPKGIKLSNTFYNIDFQIDNNLDTVFLVEGMFDVWNLVNLGINNVVACFGSHLTEQQEEIIMKHFPNVILGYDNDKAGIDCTKTTIEKLKNKCNLRCLDLGDYNDPGELKSLSDVKVISWYEWLNKH